MKKISIKYWNKFYKKIKLTKKPTQFAKFCKTKIKNHFGLIFDVGCGNGRDVLYFNKEKINCTGIDNSNLIIKKNKTFKNSFIKKKFLKANFCTYFKKKIDQKFSIYSRFTLHAINYQNEKKFLSYLSKQKNLEYLYIETRTIKDKLYGIGKKIGKHEYISSHYRRFIDPKEIKKKLRKHFFIKYFKEGKNFAIYKNENPWVLRIIAKKK